MAKSFQDILRRRQEARFVGREKQLDFFGSNLQLSPEDPQRCFIVNISGQGGVGKTSLLDRFCQIAQEADAAVASTNESESGVPDVMGLFAEQFKAYGCDFKAFGGRYRALRELRKEIEADPEAPQGFPALLGRMLARGGVHLARRAPVAGVAAELIDEDAVADLGEEFATYVARKIKNKDDVRLVLEPVEVLTPIFLSDLQEVAGERTVILLFDTYERTSAFLDSWLLDLLRGRYGDVPPDILLVIAGREELDRNYWSPYEGVLSRFHLDPFTKDEALTYLRRRGITDERVTKVILSLSGRLPLLVAMLAAESPQDPKDVGDPTGEAVERFLSWVEDSERRQLALDAALPRTLNEDVLGVLVGAEQARRLFLWLRDMPFVEKQGSGWVYHDVVRTQMLRHKRQESPRGWADLHQQLADYYERLRGDLGLDDKVGRKDPTWREYALEALYHRLCQEPQKQTTQALHGFVEALDTRRSLAQYWADTIREAGRDTETDSVLQWGKRLTAGLLMYEEYSYQGMSSMLDTLLDQGDLLSEDRTVILFRRAMLHLLFENYERALSDFDAAIEGGCVAERIRLGRILTLLMLGRRDEALEEVDRVDAVDEDGSSEEFLRAAISMQLGRVDEMAEHILSADAEEIVSVWRGSRESPGSSPPPTMIRNAMNLFGKGCDYAALVLDMYENADDSLGQLMQKQIDILKAIRDASPERAALMLETVTSMVAQHASGLDMIGTEQPPAELGDDPHQDPELLSMYIQFLGISFNLMREYPSAASTLDMGVPSGLDGPPAESIAASPQTFREAWEAVLARDRQAAIGFMHIVADSLKDCGNVSFDYLPELSEPISVEGKPEIAEHHAPQKSDNEAIYEAMISATLAAACYCCGAYARALDLYAQAIAADHAQAEYWENRGTVRAEMGDLAEALADFDSAIRLDPHSLSAAMARGKVRMKLAQYEEALSDFDRAVELDPGNFVAVMYRGEIYQLKGDYGAALSDFEYAATLPGSVSSVYLNAQGLVLSYLGRYEEAAECHIQLLEDDPQDFDTLYNLAIAVARWKGVSEARSHIERARTALQSVLETDLHGFALYGLGGLRAVEGAYSDALDLLSESVLDEIEVIQWAQHDVAWLDLRENSRFQELLRYQRGRHR